MTHPANWPFPTKDKPLTPPPKVKPDLSKYPDALL
jgi:hypothetical protein